jgi:signal peptidase II
MKKWMWLLLFILGIDVVTKIAAIQWIPPFGYGPYPFGGIPIFSLGGITFSLNYITNTGAAWGVFSGYSGLLFSFRTAIIFALVFFSPKRFPIWLIVTGAVGNCIDYLLYGHVIDFFHFTFWGYQFPIFNVADSCITLGVLALFLFPGKTKEVNAL